MAWVGAASQPRCPDAGAVRCQALDADGSLGKESGLVVLACWVVVVITARRAAPCPCLGVCILGAQPWDLSHRSARKSLELTGGPRHHAASAVLGDLCSRY